jgi:cytochrome c553
MKRVTVSLVCLLVLSTMFPPASVNATPFYKKVFDLIYVPRAPGVKTTCAVCHPSKSKKKLNRYSKTLNEELRGKDTRDPVVVARAMLAIEHLFPGLPKGGD